ncbi:MAG: putative lipid II flippase FtsW [Eubacteriales bacterium]|nr:putative lipid II flippase FtsW [Eubacteriales bacterium]MDD4511812.1 putative lipid II flippase FtsW [Eubacteriales bacterium]
MDELQLSRGLSRKAGRPVDSGIIMLVVLLVCFGLLTLFSATYYKAQDSGDALAEVKSQSLGIALGFVAMFFTSRIPYEFFRKRYVLLTLIISSLVLLALVLIPGIGQYRNGSRRWFSLGGLSVQPSEIVKFAAVIYMAGVLSNVGGKIKRLWSVVVPVLSVPLVFFLLILEQPNLSTAGSILIVCFLMVMMAGAKKRHLLLMLAGGLVMGAYYAWSEPYRRERLLSFMNPFAQMSDEGYQLSQSLIAFGSGGLFGMGLGQGRQKFSYLPYPESDFIFAIVGEDFGLFGCTVVISLFVVFLFMGMRVAVRCRDLYGSLLAAGITMMICTQAFLNIGVVIGILPTTGLPLPFFSSGGTSVSIALAAVGILLSVSRSVR